MIIFSKKALTRFLLLLTLVLNPLRLSAANRTHYEIRPTLLGGLAGLSAGLIASAMLLAKDALLGVVIPGGPEYWGKDVVVPLTLMIVGVTVVGGGLGYYNALRPQR